MSLEQRSYEVELISTYAKPQRIVILGARRGIHRWRIVTSSSLVRSRNSLLPLFQRNLERLPDRLTEVHATKVFVVWHLSVFLLLASRGCTVRGGYSHLGYCTFSVQSARLQDLLGGSRHSGRGRALEWGRKEEHVQYRLNRSRLRFCQHSQERLRDDIAKVDREEWRETEPKNHLHDRPEDGPSRLRAARLQKGGDGIRTTDSRTDGHSDYIRLLNLVAHDADGRLVRFGQLAAGRKGV